MTDRLSTRFAACKAQARAALASGEPLPATAQSGQVLELMARLDVRFVRVSPGSAPELTAKERDEVHRTVRRVVDKLLHQPTVRAKELAIDGRFGEYEDALRQLFDLHAEGSSL